MDCRVVHLVGDKFKRFRNANKCVVALSDFYREISENLGDSPLTVVVGQGIDRDRFWRLYRRLEQTGLSSKVRFWGLTHEPIDKGPVHKQRAENVMISRPRRMSKREFEIPICVDERCAEMSDHLTGQHVQGMVLMEAARQSFLAVTELFFAKSDSEYYFVIQEMNMQYGTFTFPLPATIRYSIHQSETDKRDNMSFDVRLKFIQCNQVVSQAAIRFVAYTKDSIERVEAQKARGALVNTEKMVRGLSEGAENWWGPGFIRIEDSDSVLPAP